MHLSKFSDYSFRALVYLAKHPDELCTIETLANEAQTSIHHMKKVIHKLSMLEYIDAKKGRNGGVILGKKPNQINLKDVLLATEENLQLVECLRQNQQCHMNQVGCHLQGIVSQATNQFLQTFSMYTIQDLIK